MATAAARPRRSHAANTSPTFEQVERLIDKALDAFTEELSFDLSDAEVAGLAGKVMEHVRPELADALAKTRGVERLEIVLPDQTVRAVKGRPHPALAKAVRLAAARLNVLLVGPAGSGKSYIGQQIAEALGLDFAFISCSAGMSEGQLLGRLLPTGEGGRMVYARSEFVRCYEEGGVFLFDEIDAADPNTLLVINTALSNGHLAVPNRVAAPVAKRHPDFVCVAAANTFGTGADRQYVGRSQLDESTLDRFRVGQIEVDYDAALEEALCPDADLLARLRGYRDRCRENRLRRLVSMRFVRDAYKVKLAGLTDEDVDAALMAGWTPDEVRKVRGY